MVRAVVTAAAHVADAVVTATAHVAGAVVVSAAVVVIAVVVIEMPVAMLAANVLDGIVVALAGQGNPGHGKRGGRGEGQQSHRDSRAHLVPFGLGLLLHTDWAKHGPNFNRT